MATRWQSVCRFRTIIRNTSTISLRVNAVSPSQTAVILPPATGDLYNHEWTAKGNHLVATICNRSQNVKNKKLYNHHAATIFLLFLEMQGGCFPILTCGTEPLAGSELGRSVGWFFSWASLMFPLLWMLVHEMNLVVHSILIWFFLIKNFQFYAGSVETEPSICSVSKTSNIQTN